MVTGTDSASCQYTCIWCKCPALERHITDEKWSISDTECGAHSIVENIELPHHLQSNSMCHTTAVSYNTTNMCSGR